MKFFATLAILAGAVAMASATNSAEAADLSTTNPVAYAYVKHLITNPPAAEKRSDDGRGQRPRRRQTAEGGKCNTGNATCCNQSITDTSTKNTLAGLLGLDSLIGIVGLDCAQLPINAVGGAVAAQNTCKSTPLCCDNVTQNGLINFGCINLPIN